MFSAFDFTGVIDWTRVIAGYNNTTTGTWVPESTSTGTIKGHLSDITQEELVYYPSGTTIDGARQIATSSNLLPNDRLTITELDGSTSYWYVLKRSETKNVLYNFTGIIRNKYYLIRQK